MFWKTLYEPDDNQYKQMAYTREAQSMLDIHTL
jgi:hypothetical protein